MHGRQRQFCSAHKCSHGGHDHRELLTHDDRLVLKADCRGG